VTELARDLEEAWRDVFTDIFGRAFSAAAPDDAKGQWERFRAERLPEILARSHHRPGNEVEVICEWFEETWLWICEQALTEALSAPGSGWVSTFVPTADGKLKQLWGEKGEVGGAAN
jgi:hypothetical protein